MFLFLVHYCGRCGGQKKVLINILINNQTYFFKKIQDLAKKKSIMKSGTSKHVQSIFQVAFKDHYSNLIQEMGK